VPTDNYGSARHSERGSLPPVVCVEPAMVPIQGIHPARVLTRVQIRSNLQQTSPQGQIVCEAPRNCAYVMLTNFSDEALTVPKATVLGVAEGISESIVDKINKVGQSSSNAPTESRNGEKTRSCSRNFWKGNWITYRHTKDK